MKNIQNSNKVMMIATLLMLFFTVGANAQRYGRRGGPKMQNPLVLTDSARVDRMVDRMAEDLALSDSQVEKIRKIHYTHIEEAQKHREKMRAIAEKNREEMDESRKEMDRAIMDILTDEQREEFENFHPGRGRGYFGPDGPCYNSRPGRGRRGFYCPFR